MGNTGQMLLVLGALLLFSIALPSLNDTLLHNDLTLFCTNAELTALSLCQKFLGEAGTKVFDEVCLTTQPQLATQLTDVGNLGRETGESYPNFDDVDDYHNLAFRDSTTLPSVLFIVSGNVTYIDPGDPAHAVAYRTFVKRLRITVRGPYLLNLPNDQLVDIVMEQLYTQF